MMYTILGLGAFFEEAFCTFFGAAVTVPATESARSAVVGMKVFILFIFYVSKQFVGLGITIGWSVPHKRYDNATDNSENSCYKEDFVPTVILAQCSEKYAGNRSTGIAEDAENAICSSSSMFGCLHRSASTQKRLRSINEETGQDIEHDDSPNRSALPKTNESNGCAHCADEACPMGLALKITISCPAGHQHTQDTAYHLCKTDRSTCCSDIQTFELGQY